MSLVLVAGPKQEPLDAWEAKARLGIGDEISNETIDAWIMAERQKLDGWFGMLTRAFITQTWDLVIDSAYWGWPSGIGDGTSYNAPPSAERGYAGWYGSSGILLPLPPFQSVVSITHYDAAGAPTVVAPSSYRVLAGEPTVLIPTSGNSWPAIGPDERLVVRFICGYGDTGEDVPENIKAAIVAGIGMMRTTWGNPLLRSETVDGVGSVTYETGSGVRSSMSSIQRDLLAPFQTGGIS